MLGLQLGSVRGEAECGLRLRLELRHWGLLWFGIRIERLDGGQMGPRSDNANANANANANPNPNRLDGGHVGLGRGSVPDSWGVGLGLWVRVMSQIMHRAMVVATARVRVRVILWSGFGLGSGPWPGL